MIFVGVMLRFAVHKTLHMCCLSLESLSVLQDLQDSGASLAVILAAGEWKGRAVVSYIDLNELERDVALEASMLSDDEGDG